MSSGLVRCAFDSLIEQESEQVDGSPRLVSARISCPNILEKASADEAAMTRFDGFCDELTACLRGIFKPNATYCSIAAKHEKLCSAFHQIRLTAVPQI